MKNKNSVPTWFKWAYKAATAPLRTKLTVIGIGLAFAAAGRLTYLQAAVQAPQPPQEPVSTPATPVVEMTPADHNRLMTAYTTLGIEPPARPTPQP